MELILLLVQCNVVVLYTTAPSLSLESSMLVASASQNAVMQMTDRPNNIQKGVSGDVSTSYHDAHTQLGQEGHSELMAYIYEWKHLSVCPDSHAWRVLWPHRKQQAEIQCQMQRW